MKYEVVYKINGRYKILKGLADIKTALDFATAVDGIVLFSK